MATSPEGHVRIKSVYNSLLDAQAGERQDETPALVSLARCILIAYLDAGRRS